jgi:hypothetical protein
MLSLNLFSEEEVKSRIRTEKTQVVKGLSALTYSF